MNRYCISNQLVQHKPRDIYSIETYACLDDTLIYNFSLKTPSNKFQPCYFVYCLCVELVCDYYSLKVHPQQEVFCHDCSLSAPSVAKIHSQKIMSKLLITPFVLFQCTFQGQVYAVGCGCGSTQVQIKTQLLPSNFHTIYQPAGKQQQSAAALSILLQLCPQHT